jgi:hypothetical protein
MLDFFRLSKDGRHYRRIVQGFQRIFAATIFFGTEDQPGETVLSMGGVSISSITSDFGLTILSNRSP